MGKLGVVSSVLNQGTGAASTLLLTCGHFFRGSSLVRPLRFRGGTVVLPLLIRDAAPFFMGVGFVGILTAFSRLQPFFIGVQFVKFSGVHGAGYSRTYFVLIHPVSVLPPWSDHGKGRFWAPLAFFASRVGRMIAATIKSPWRASCDLVCQYLALSWALCRRFSPADPLLIRC